MVIRKEEWVLVLGFVNVIHLLRMRNARSGKESKAVSLRYRKMTGYSSFAQENSYLFYTTRFSSGETDPAILLEGAESQ